MALSGATAVVTTILFLFFWVLLPTLWVTFDEMGLPSADHVTDGLVVTSDEMGCGTRGCWRTLTVQPPEGQSPEQLIAAWDVKEGCAAQSWIDRRPVCTGYSVQGDAVRVSLEYKRIPK